MERISTLAYNNQILFQTLNNVSRLQELQLQLATDKKSQDYAGIQRETVNLVSLEVRQTQAEQFNRTIQSADIRLELMDTALGSIGDVAVESRDLFLNAVNGPGTFDGNLAEFAADWRFLTVQFLNTRGADGYLFGGTRSDRPPVDLTQPAYTPVSLIESDGTTVDETFYQSYYTQVLGNTLPFAQGSFYDQIYFDKNGVAPAGPLPADPDNPTLSEFVAEDPDLWQYYVDRLDSAAMLATPKLDYYQGNDEPQVVRADDDLDVSYDVRANELTFQQVLIALDAVANLPNGGSTADPFQNVVIAKARDILNSVLDPFSTKGVELVDDQRIEVSRARGTLSFAAERNEAFVAQAEGLIADIEGIDRAEVVVKIQSSQTVLEASFASLSRVQSLSLLQFL